MQLFKLASENDWREWLQSDFVSPTGLRSGNTWPKTLLIITKRTYLKYIICSSYAQNTYRAENIATTIQYIHRSEEYKESMQDIQTSSWRKITLQEVAEMVAWVKHSPCAGVASSWIYQIGQLGERENYKHIFISVSEYDPGWLRYMQEVQVVPLYFACWICLHGAKRYMEYYICRRIEELRLEIYRDFIDLASRRCMFDPILRKSW